jgi:hypothetical protein
MKRLAPTALVLWAIVACSTQTEDPTEPDTTAPVVLSTAPTDGAADVTVASTITAGFSEPMRPESVSTAFSLVGPAGFVPGSVAVPTDGRALTFTPATALDPDCVYTAWLSAAAQDVAGNSLLPVTWSFRTAPLAVTGFHVVSVSPAAASLASAALTATVRATFDAAIDCAHLPAGALAVTELGVYVPGHLECSGATLEFVPVPALPTNTSLVATLSPVVRDLAGNPVGAEKVWSFDVLPWTRELGSAAEDDARSVAVDAAGNVFVAGYTKGSLDGNTSAGGWDMFLVKYAPSGKKLWTRQLGTAASDTAYGVVVDAGGNAFVAGITGGALGGNTSAGADDIFLAKLDPTGATSWIRQVGSAGYDCGFAVAIDPAGNVFVAGSTDGAFPGSTNAGGADVLLVKFAPDGTTLWARQLGSADYEYAHAVAVDADGNAFVAGSTSGALDGVANAGLDDLFLVKYAPDGRRLWIRQLGSPSFDLATSVAVDAAGNALVAGHTTGNLDGHPNQGAEDLFVAKYDAAGTKLWSTQVGSAAFDFAYGLALDAAGNAFVAGHTDGAFDGNVYAGSNDLLLVKLDPSGAKVWTRQFGTASLEDVFSVALDAAGDAFVAGYTNADLDGNFLVGGVSDLFVVKYGPDGRRR